MAETVLAAYETDIDELDIVMGEHGVFRVSVDGETVYDKDEDAFGEDAIAAAVGEAV